MEHLESLKLYKNKASILESNYFKNLIQEQKLKKTTKKMIYGFEIFLRKHKQTKKFQK